MKEKWRDIRWKEVFLPEISKRKNLGPFDKPWIQLLKGLGLVFLGSFLSALAINMFYLPFQFTMGGVSGIAAIIHYLSDGAVPVGTLNFLINIPLLYLAFKDMGLRFLWKTLVGTFLFSLTIDLFAPTMNDWLSILVQQNSGQMPEMFLFAIVGGILFGIGLGFIFMGGYTTGGCDIVAVYFTKRIHSLSLGQIILIMDAIIISLTLIVPPDSERPVAPILLAMYSFLSLYVSTKAIDLVLGGFNFSRAAFIISDKSEEISTAILEVLDRGCTALKGRGMYTRKDKNVLFCVLNNRLLPKLKETVSAIDPSAFIVVTDARDVYGEGFGENSFS